MTLAANLKTEEALDATSNAVEVIPRAGPAESHFKRLALDRASWEQRVVDGRLSTAKWPASDRPFRSILAFLLALVSGSSNLA